MRRKDEEGGPEEAAPAPLFSVAPQRLLGSFSSQSAALAAAERKLQALWLCSSED
eukprot:CAMPEP_0119362170 /NCGR_PEP_ID=MMETSP1334-20130426/9307_1 /TAXON_ID=127549 /ORGANISM="Calcidiscus leptoporus, Strain RCC1130" /LENGTH=54 /DNA_ID=CAMNT_0007377345 /DNA_START=351 /DNA_END=515 /DNA_ORIENTATION=+